MAVAAISSKGWLVIPVELRKKYNLYSGRQTFLISVVAATMLQQRFSQEWLLNAPTRTILRPSRAFGPGTQGQMSAATTIRREKTDNVSKG